MKSWNGLGVIAMALVSLGSVSADDATPLSMRLRSQSVRAEAGGRFAIQEHEESWKPSETAIIVCDVWDYHHCLNAVRRLEEFGPRLDATLAKARQRGVTIIHSPSDCMPAYEGHPARVRAQKAPTAANGPTDVDLWCSKIPAEEKGNYPIDQSDGGEDDVPAEHAAWAEKLRSLGRNPNMPWKRQSDLIKIDAERDYLSDRGDEVWNVLESRGIRNVILTGVHTNMCVLGRPFGLRQMVRGGKNVVLMRDMTDCMYNPARWPYVNHYAGNDLIISHVERYVCPTVTSDQILGGKPFRFGNDPRKRLALVIAEDGYHTDATLPDWAQRMLLPAFQIDYVLGSKTERTSIPGLERLDDADVLLLSVRRRVLKPESLGAVRRFVAAGKPVIGLRTASHAFALRDASPPSGLEAWTEFDAQVLGGKYVGHPEGDAPAEIVCHGQESKRHPLLADLTGEAWQRRGALYVFEKLAPKTIVLWTGRHDGQQEMPVAWTFERADGGKSFYTSLGETFDFDRSGFERLLMAAVFWSVGAKSPANRPTKLPAVEDWTKHWTSVAVPQTLGEATCGAVGDDPRTAWYRGVVKIAKSADKSAVTVTFQTPAAKTQAWWNGKPLEAQKAGDGEAKFRVPPAAVEPGEANLIVVRLADQLGAGGLRTAPAITVAAKPVVLEGRWQLRLGDDATWSNMPLPAKFGAPTDIVHDPK